MNNNTQTCNARPSFLDRLNGSWHEKALYLYTAIVLAHWAEHFAQAFQIYALGWKLPDARGVVGIWFPALIKSEALHYGYALVMIVAFWMLRKGFVGRSKTWWMVAFWIQFWHHIEHFILQAQAVVGSNLFGSPVPMSLVQLVVPRVELHLFYNTLVTIPMAIAMFYHMFPSREEEAHMQCSCSWHPKVAGNSSSTHPEHSGGTLATQS